MKVCYINGFVLFFSLLSFKTYSQNNLDTTSILNIIKKAYEICENDPEKTIELGNKALRASLKTNYLKGEVSAYNVIGVGYDVSAKYDSSISYYFKGLKLSEKISDNSLKASIYNNIGLTYWNLSDYKNAINNYYKALSIFKISKDLKGIAKTHNNLGLLYEDMLDSKTAIQQYKESIRNYTELKDTNGLSVAYLNLGSSYNSLNNFIESEYFYKKSFSLKQENDYYGKSIVLLNWAQVKNALFQTDTAITLIQQAIKDKEKINDTNGLISAYNVMANTYNVAKQYQKSIEASKNALLLNNNLQSKRRLVKTYALLKKSYMYLNLPDSASKYNDLEYDIKDSIFSENLSEAIANERVKFSTLSVENENLSLKIEKEEQGFLIKIIIISIVFISIIVLIFYISNRNNRKNRKALETQKIQNKINETVIVTEELERERIAADLHDSLGQKLSVVKMQLSLNNIDQNLSSKLVDEAIGELRTISHNLMPPDLNQGLEMALQNMQEQINFINSNLKLQIELDDRIKNATFSKSMSLLTYRMVQELVNNAIKHANAKEINVELKHEENKINLIVFDNGVGFNSNDKLSKGGMGLSHIKEKMIQLNGEMLVESNIGKGSRFTLSFPA
jgi:two-component system, NarL family, sensor kinase